jgi:clan AA aspartic protease (TIGR02281 family)
MRGSGVQIPPAAPEQSSTCPRIVRCSGGSSEPSDNTGCGRVAECSPNGKLRTRSASDERLRPFSSGHEQSAGSVAVRAGIHQGASPSGSRRLFASCFVLAVVFTASSAVGQTVSLLADEGQFRTQIIINDEIAVAALIDTGATSLGICASTAEELRLAPGPSLELETSGGRLLAHRVRLSLIRIGPIVVHDVAAVVHPATPWCGESLVGLSLLRRLRMVILAGDRLTLVGNAPRLPRPSAAAARRQSLSCKHSRAQLTAHSRARRRRC